MNLVIRLVFFWSFVGQSLSYAVIPLEVSAAVAQMKPLLSAKRPFHGSSPIVFKGVKFPVFYQFKGPELTVVISDAMKKSANLSSSDWLYDCLFLVANVENKTAKLDLVNAKPAGCPIPSERRGTFLMEFSDELIKQLGMKKSSLVDASEIECKKSDKSTIFSFLRIMQKGSTWYEGFGYKPIDTAYNKNVEYLRNIPVVILVDVMEKSKAGITQRASLGTKSEQESYKEYLTSFDSRLEVLKTKIAEFSTKTDSKNLANFLSWLWDNNCSDYIEVKEFLFPEFTYGYANIVNAPPWWDTFGSLLKSMNKLEKSIP